MTIARAAIDDFAAASQALADAVLAATTDPADAIRLLVPLAQWRPPPVVGSGALSAAIRAATSALAGNLQVSACVALATAAQSYAPLSYEDAQSVRMLVCGTIDNAATVAADAGRLETYQALRALRAAVALDLAVRGASLPWLVEVTTRVPTPALAEAWTLYQDTSRTPELVASANPPHPAWMPLEFPALSF